MIRMPGIALSLVRVTKAYGAAPILADLSFGLMMGEKVGLIGRNGSGKTTLFKLLSREEAPDSGEVVVTQGLRVAHLPQDPHFPPGATVRTALEEALADHRALLARHAEIHRELRPEGDSAGSSRLERLHADLEAVEHHLGHLGWDLEPRLKEARTVWGLADLETPVETLSGGWRKRVALAQAWLKDPDVLILDEPTNHLDSAQVEKLELWLAKFEGALLLITHDRHLLDSAVDRMLELERGQVTSYDGSYSDYLLEKADRDFREARLTEHMQNRLRREMAWLRRGARARTRKSKLRIQEVLDLKGSVQERTYRAARQDLVFRGGEARGDLLLSAEKVRFDYGDGRELAGGVDLLLQRGMRLALLGPNGCGKSTLLNLLAGHLHPTSGRIQRRPKLSLSSISQARAELDGTSSVLRNLADGSPVVEVDGTAMPASAYLARFGFGTDRQGQPAASLSGGERNRLLLAKAMLRPADLLVLDEPTNDLDIPTLQDLEEALVSYPGTLLVVSHDRFFLDQVATHTLSWNPDGAPSWELQAGNPGTAQRLRQERESGAAPPPKRESRKNAPREDGPAGRPKTRSWKEARRLSELEAAMAAANAHIAELDAVLGSPGAFTSEEAPGHTALRERAEVQELLDALELEWLVLDERGNG